LRFAQEWHLTRLESLSKVVILRATVQPLLPPRNPAIYPIRHPISTTHKLNINTEFQPPLPKDAAAAEDKRKLEKFHSPGSGSPERSSRVNAKKKKEKRLCSAMRVPCECHASAMRAFLTFISSRKVSLRAFALRDDAGRGEDVNLRGIIYARMRICVAVDNCTDTCHLRDTFTKTRRRARYFNRGSRRSGTSIHGCYRIKSALCF